MAATLELQDTQKCQVTIKVVDSKGNAAQVQGTPNWVTSNPAVCDVRPSDDGFGAELVAGIPGDATVSVSADADLGEGVSQIAGSIDVHVTPGSAVAVEIVPGTPTAQ